MECRHFVEYDETEPLWKKHIPMLQASCVHFRRFLEHQVQNSCLWLPLPEEIKLVQPRETDGGDNQLEVTEWRGRYKNRPLDT